MNDYMNADQKQAFVLLSAAGTTIGTALDSTAKHLPKEVSANIKRGRTYLTKALTTWMAPMNDSTKQAVLRISRSVNIGVVNNRTSQLDKENYERYLFGRDHFEDMAEITLQAVCSKCNGGCRDDCKLLAAYTHFDLEQWNPKHPLCPYAGAGVAGGDG